MPSVLLSTSAAMIAFASNSIFARLALGPAAADPAGYTTVRLVSGAAILAFLLLSGRREQKQRPPLPGSWLSAFALFAYAILFSLAYVHLGAAMGALILFTTVQGTMIGWGLATGNRPNALEITGIAVALAAFVYLLLPGLTAPDPLGSVLMIASGIAWGAYSLRGRGATNPLQETAGNFIRTVPMCLPLVPFAVSSGGLTMNGVLLAVASGVLASAIGYAIWYRALPSLSAVQASIVQLTVPVIAAFGAVLFLAETLTARLVITSIFILGGVALAIFARAPKRG